MVPVPSEWSGSRALPCAPLQPAQQRPRATPGVGSFLCSLPLRPAGEALGSAGGAPTRSLSATGSSSGSGAPGPSGLVRQNSTSLAGKPGALPANLDDMKVGGCALVALGAASLASRGAVRCLASCREGGRLGTTAMEGSRAPDSGLLQWRHLEPSWRLAWLCSSWSLSLKMPAGVHPGRGLTEHLCASDFPASHAV